MGRLAAFFVTLAAVVLLAGCDTEVKYSCLTFSDVGFGPAQETWQCFDRSDHDQATPHVTLLRLEGSSDGFGEVSVSDTTHPAAFGIDGLNRRWNFGCDERDGAYPYAFIIKPDGAGLYYNFRPSTDGTATPSDLFDCLMLP